MEDVDHVGRMDADGDESFDDDWWDSLAIDPVTDTQLQALEIQAQASGNVNTPASTAPSEPASLQAQLQELRALQAKQQELIDTLTRQTQQQKGEIAVVRANWKRAQEQNSGLQQKQTQLESEYRERFERIQQENRRQIEKLETAAAFRVRIPSHRSALNRTRIARHGPHRCAVVRR